MTTAGITACKNHETVKHSVGEYVDGHGPHERYRVLLEPCSRGATTGCTTSMSPEHLDRYVTEFSGRHNLRNEDTVAQMVAVFRGTVGRRLKYDDLIAPKLAPVLTAPGSDVF